MKCRECLQRLTTWRSGSWWLILQLLLLLGRELPWGNISVLWGVLVHRLSQSTHSWYLAKLTLPFSFIEVSKAVNKAKQPHILIIIIAPHYTNSGATACFPVTCASANPVIVVLQLTGHYHQPTYYQQRVPCDVWSWVTQLPNSILWVCIMVLVLLPTFSQSGFPSKQYWWEDF